MYVHLLVRRDSPSAITRSEKGVAVSRYSTATKRFLAPAFATPRWLDLEPRNTREPQLKQR